MREVGSMLKILIVYNTREKNQEASYKVKSASLRNPNLISKQTSLKLASRHHYCKL